MRLPFVAREAYDEAREEIAYLRDQLQAERAHSAAITAQIATLAERTVPTPPKIPERTRDDVIDAILSRAGTNGQLRAHLAAWAQQQRRANVPDDEIIQQIVVWQSSDEDGVS